MSNLVIRDATIADAEEISSLLIRSITDLCGEDHLDDPKLIEGWVANKTPDHVREWIENGAQMRVSEAGDRIGAVGCYTDDGMIQLLYVSPEARGQGHSSAILKIMEDEMRASGIQAARLVSSKTAQAYYTKQGWDIDGARVVCYTTDGQPMYKRLNPTNE